ncbi:hypothetical protein C8R43DRAFT_1195974 [Mycena crocata]|nr:hypothetical protein C8R43DRAFT_1195974 [Mycena crocata]
MSTEAELRKLTVPQLKALCKEKRITGYSKLSKDPLIRKLLGSAASSTINAPPPSLPVVVAATPAPDTKAGIDAPPSLTPQIPPTSTPHPPHLPPQNTAPDTSTSSSNAAESVPKARPKKRKAPPASKESVASSSSQVFKVPAVPHRPVQVSTGTASASTPAVPKQSNTNKPIPSTTNAAADPPPKRRKTIPADVPLPSTATISVAHNTIMTQTVSVPRAAVSAGLLTSSPINSLTSNGISPSRTPDVPKRPSTTSSSTVNTSPAKKRKLAPPLPTTKTATVFLPPKKAASTASNLTSPPPSEQVAPVVPVATIVAKVSIPATLYHLDLPISPIPAPLSAITLPPSLSQRKRVPRFAILLSGVADEDLRNCVLVSRMFRYAGELLYLSAFQRLTQNFAGKRLSMVLAKHSQAMTNMWPYLKQRTQELSFRKYKYNASFLSRLFPSGTSNPISERLWTSPDHERQIVIALRFLSTRLFLQVSVGGGKDGKGWLEGQIVDAQQLVKDEVWIITVRHSPTSTESFYVLEPTCEPLTATTDSVTSGVSVRADWSAYIAHRETAASVRPSTTSRLLDYLSWTNHEEYHLGISRLWLKRIEAEGEIGIVKRITAERYILACVVGNRRVFLPLRFMSSFSPIFSLSGRWMSSTQMAHDFAGLAEVVPARSKPNPKVNLFLPAHHHVESVHFTVSGRAGIPLHNALAVVQTPGREYFILRDNGMQVGCEEDGVAEVWTNILGCDNSGVALSA